MWWCPETGFKKHVLEYHMCYNSIRYTTINSDVAYYNFMVHCFNM